MIMITDNGYLMITNKDQGYLKFTLCVLQSVIFGIVMRAFCRGLSAYGGCHLLCQFCKRSLRLYGCTRYTFLLGNLL